MGTCERCNEWQATARYRDDGIAFQRLGEQNGGHWLCKDCVQALEDKREHVRNQLTSVRGRIPGLDGASTGCVDDVPVRLDRDAHGRGGEA